MTVFDKKDTSASFGGGVSTFGGRVTNDECHDCFANTDGAEGGRRAILLMIDDNLH